MLCFVFRSKCEGQPILTDHAALLVCNRLIYDCFSVTIEPPFSFIPAEIWRISDSYICDPWMRDTWNVVEESWQEKSVSILKKLSIYESNVIVDLHFYPLVFQK